MFGFTNFLPPELQDIAAHAPRIIFRSLPLSQLMVEAAQTAKNMMDGEKQEKMKHALTPELSLAGVEWVDQGARSISKLTPEQGCSVLKLYFLQLKLSRKVFLDLRTQNFFEGPHSLGWRPTPLIHEFSVAFHEGILLLYAGFFSSDDSKMDEGLIRTGMASSGWSSHQMETLRNLFKNHFGNAQNEAVPLNLETFKRSFTTILEFMDRENVKISIDFLYFGIYLVSLYLTLDAAGSPFAVKKLYDEVFGAQPS